LPDATLAVVRNLDQIDLKKIGLKTLMVNTYHLINRPGKEILEKAKGVKKFMNWDGLVSSDSGGFQLFSLIQKNPNLGKITDEGVVLYTGEKKQKKKLFTPEDSIKMQFAIGSDIMICLDDFTPPGADEKRIEESVKRSIDWAKRSKIEFEKQLKIHNFDSFDKNENRPFLLAPIQGHKNKKWRQYCADELLKISFDIYGLGGWPFDQDGNFDYDYCQFNASLTPDEFPRFALGVGTPENITKLFFMGYQIFDCVLPTRDARHQRLYTFKINPKNLNQVKLAELNKENRLNEVFDFLYIGKGKFKDDFTAISEHCDCPLCQNTAVNRAYLHHLFKVGDGAAFRLASLHNLRSYTLLMEALNR
jgi:queuine tRNA-ribosyltransferase